MSTSSSKETNSSITLPTLRLLRSQPSPNSDKADVSDVNIDVEDDATTSAKSDVSSYQIKDATSGISSTSYDKKPWIRSRSLEVLPSETLLDSGPTRKCHYLTISGLTDKKRLQLKTALQRRFYDNYIDKNGLTLIYSRHEKVPFKDFSNEVRAIKDVQNFINQTALLLHMDETNLNRIIVKILKKMLGHLENYEQCKMQAEKHLFTRDKVHQLSRTLQCSTIDASGGFVYEQNFVCAISSILYIQNSFVGIGRLNKPTNFGQTCEEVSFVVVILAPIREKGTKNELEIGRTFATMLSNMDFRQALLNAPNKEKFLDALKEQMHILSEYHRYSEAIVPNFDRDLLTKKVTFHPFRGLRGDFKRRIVHYKSDYLDGVSDIKTIQKVISTTFFLYFACLLPSIAFGVLNAFNTNDILTVEKVLYTQTFGGLVFAVFGGSPQIVLLTTAPLALFTKIIFSICEDYEMQFQSMYCCVGLWNAFFLVLYGIFNISNFMQFSTRSTEEIFSLFIATAFAHGAFKNMFANFDDNYHVLACKQPGDARKVQLTTLLTKTSIVTTSTLTGIDNITEQTWQIPSLERCHRDISMLYLLLLFGTVLLGVTLFKFTNKPYLTAGKREIFSDYSLPAAVIIMSVIGSYFFHDVKMGNSFNSYRDPNLFQLNTMADLPVGAIFAAMALGFVLSLLFFMGQNICSKFVNDPNNRMKKGSAYHWDLLVIALVNAVLSLYTFPWLHAALPHSPMHVYALADMEERVEQGNIQQKVVRVRETRLTGIFSHILIGLSLLILPVLCKIPIPVLYGVFLYLAVTAMLRNEIVERITLLFMEQAAYPPNHYIRRVPQWKIHMFTMIQIAQYAVLCLVGFLGISYMKMFFPVLILLLIPIRHKLLTKIFRRRCLKAIDGH
ncbi:sodium bicarbonate transporter-like protein 11 [Gigantopelta aegis]|uniref:sodium bicarbonate transporter-like protein 11 n=1 Tax=Gigantopelta aegis TaxID=1735272 RepID=UPI001B88B14D|nr:sodium bicarbonate transporter-like protein 11 [Gigantopelta aegis]